MHKDRQVSKDTSSTGRVSARFYAYSDETIGFSPNSMIGKSGYPFQKTPSSVYTGEGIKVIPCGWTAETLYFLGLTSSDDVGYQFIGDKIGDIVIVYEDSQEVIIPLIIGFTAWYYKSWVPYALPFCGGGNPPDAPDKLRDSLYLHGLGMAPTDPKTDGAYILAFSPESGQVIRQILISNDPTTSGFPTLFGLTVQNPSASSHLSYICPDMVAPIRAVDADILGDPAGISRRIEALQRTLYTFEDSLAEHYPLDVPVGYNGPEIYFHGNNCADMLTNEYFHCLGDSMLPNWGPRSIIGNKPLGGYTNNFETYYADGAYIGGIGNYDPRDQTGGLGWTRDIGRLFIERIKAGYLDMTRDGLAFYDKVLYGCNSPEFTPQPLPHWSMHYDIDELNPSNVSGGGPSPVVTKGGQQVHGNMENDGHALIMMARYAYWMQRNQDQAWLAHTWPATCDASEWICWAVDNPVDPVVSYPPGDFRREIIVPPDCIWAENESVKHGGIDVFNNIQCYVALLASAEMAKAKAELALRDRWLSYANRIKAGILGAFPHHGFVRHEPEYGDVWYFGKTYWAGHESLAPLFAMVELSGLDISGMDAQLLQITRNTYHKIINSGPDGAKKYSATWWWAYGQSFLTETAMLLDEMEDVTHLIETTAKCIHSPFYHPWVCAEGTVVHKSGKYWRPSNWLGNEVQIASAVRDMRYIAGVDDYTGKLKIIPRLPNGWSGVSVARYPIASENGKTNFAFDYSRDDACNYSIRNFRVDEGMIPEMDIRFGPFPLHTKASNIVVLCDQNPLVVDFIESDDPRHQGDSTWAWVRASDNPQLKSIHQIEEIQANYAG